MTLIERFAGTIRHHPALRDADWLWNCVRPLYDTTACLVFFRGIPKSINGTDAIRVDAKLRGLSETYEPRVWREVMAEIRAGDSFVDVGSHIGLYAIAAAQRAGFGGHVTAFEPDAENYRVLARNARLNAVASALSLENTAVGAKSGRGRFAGGHGLESHLTDSNLGAPVEIVALDDYFKDQAVHVMKIDVEGFEQAVLEGAVALLSDPARKPRAIFIEVHPFAWDHVGASSTGLLALLERCGYRVRNLDGAPVTEIREYGEIVARRASMPSPAPTGS